jgi:hypothetical protein
LDHIRCWGDDALDLRRAPPAALVPYAPNPDAMRQVLMPNWSSPTSKAWVRNAANSGHVSSVPKPTLIGSHTHPERALLSAFFGKLRKNLNHKKTR